MTPEIIVAIGQAISYAVGIPMGIYWLGRAFVSIMNAPNDPPLSSILDKIEKPATWKDGPT